MTDLNENYFKTDIKKSFIQYEDIGIQQPQSQLLLDTDRPKSIYFSPTELPSKIEIIETEELNKNSNLLEIVEDDYMARADTNKILRPEFTTIGADEMKV